MIEINGISKSFEQFPAVDHVSVSIKENSVFGLIGTNGAGKSTVLRMLAGVLKPDEGTILVDGMQVYDNIQVKKKVFFIADEPYFFSNANACEMQQYYSTVFENFRKEEFYKHLENFGLEKKRKINTFSKGMKKQLALLCGIFSGARYLLCDETFDGLDPVMRQGIKSLFARELTEKGLTPIIASHNLRELEDICDHVGLLHKGGVLLSRDLEEMKLNIQKVQCVFRQQEMAESFQGLDLLKKEKRGSLYTLTIRGKREDILAHFAAMDLLFFEALPLSLEEIFISETEVVGYDVKTLIMG